MKQRTKMLMDTNHLQMNITKMELHIQKFLNELQKLNHNEVYIYLELSFQKENHMIQM